MSFINVGLWRVSKSLPVAVLQNSTRCFSAFNHSPMQTACHVSLPIQGSVELSHKSPPLLSPPSALIIPAAGMKQAGKLKRRCKNCFFIMIDERLHVWCDVHPRHKQMQMIPKPKSCIITTHATQGRIRPW